MDAHVADSHDLIHVQGARVNNLKDVSVEIPKRRLTVFTGVSGSGKSSLVFGTIAAESQRMINETYSAFVQGFMPTLARPDVDVLGGADDGDHRRPGTARAPTHVPRWAPSPTPTPCCASCSADSGKPAHRFGEGVLLQRARRCRAQARSRSARAADHHKEKPPSRSPVACAHGVRARATSPTSICRSSTTTTSRLGDGALTVPGYSMDGWYGRIFGGSGFFDMDKPIKKYTKKELADLLYREPTKIKVEGINLTYEGLIPKIQKSMLSKDLEAMQPHIRTFVERGHHLHDLPRMRRHPPERGSSFLKDRRHQHRRRLRDADQRPRRVGRFARRAHHCPTARNAQRHPRLVRRDWPRLPVPRSSIGNAVGR